MDPKLNTNEERFDLEAASSAPFAASEYIEMGFTPAWLDFGTQTLHPTCWSPLLVPGFERNGFFYTRTTATRAMREWRGAH